MVILHNIALTVLYTHNRKLIFSGIITYFKTLASNFNLHLSGKKLLKQITRKKFHINEPVPSFNQFSQFSQNCKVKKKCRCTLANNTCWIDKCYEAFLCDPKQSLSDPGNPSIPKITTLSMQSISAAHHRATIKRGRVIRHFGSCITCVFYVKKREELILFSTRRKTAPTRDT